MNRAILVELAVYTPTLLCYLDQQERKTVQHEIGLSAIQLYEWKQGGSGLLFSDIIEQAYKDKNDWIIDLISPFVNHSTVKRSVFF